MTKKKKKTITNNQGSLKLRLSLVDNTTSIYDFKLHVKQVSLGRLLPLILVSDYEHEEYKVLQQFGKYYGVSAKFLTPPIFFIIGGRQRLIPQTTDTNVCQKRSELRQYNSLNELSALPLGKNVLKST
jgi:hypothetical protein